MRAFCNAFLAQKLSGLIYQISVPGSPQSCATGQTCGGDAGKEFRASNTIGAVGSANRGDVKFGNRMRVPEINSCFALADESPEKSLSLSYQIKERSCPGR